MNIPIKPAITLLIGADACSVKDEVYRIMHRYQLKTFVVANCCGKSFFVPSR